MKFQHGMVAPLVALFVGVVGFPLAYAFYLSITDYRLTSHGTPKLVGAHNYVATFGDAEFWHAFGTTALYVCVAVGLELVVGLAIALALQKQRWARDLTRSMLLAPMFITPIAVGLIFRFLLNDQLGAIPHMLRALGVDYDFFGPGRALFTLALIDVWQWTPFMVLLLLAGLQSIPREPLEAARVDGASGWYVLRRVTLPLLAPVLVVAILLRCLDAMKVFEYVFATTRGGPGHRDGDAAVLRLPDRDSVLPARFGVVDGVRGPAAGADNHRHRVPADGEGESIVRGSIALAVCRVALLWAAGITVLFPVVWIALASVKTPEQLSDPFLLSFTPTLDSWRNVLTSGILAAAGRSAIVAIVTVGISVVVGSMGAYAIARYRAGGTATRFGMLAAQVLPPAVLVFPFLTMAYALRLNDTLIPVIFAHLSFVLPVVTWFLIGFFEAVPRSLEEQAQVDGFTRFAAFRLVVLPQVLPGIGAAAIFGFTLSWNDLFYGLILAPGKAAILPVAIAGFNTFRGVQIGSMSAAILIAVVPVVIASFFIQRRLVQGISGGAVKF